NKEPNAGNTPEDKDSQPGRVQLPPDSQEVQMQSFSSWIHSAEIQTNQQLGRQTKICASKGFFSKK
ncbi:hypothetical protein P3447_27380, partial [Vibrio parahaemolyticus]|nr:hypothetical protein [Vibrio parahaemolyticus]